MVSDPKASHTDAALKGHQTLSFGPDKKATLRVTNISDKNPSLARSATMTSPVRTREGTHDVALPSDSTRTLLNEAARSSRELYTLGSIGAFSNAAKDIMHSFGKDIDQQQEKLNLSIREAKNPSELIQRLKRAIERTPDINTPFEDARTDSDFSHNFLIELPQHTLEELKSHLMMRWMELTMGWGSQKSPDDACEALHIAQLIAHIDTILANLAPHDEHKEGAFL